MDTNKTETPQYEAPTVVDYGDIFEITAQIQGGKHADAVIQIGQLTTTFSY